MPSSGTEAAEPVWIAGAMPGPSAAPAGQAAAPAPKRSEDMKQSGVSGGEPDDVALVGRLAVGDAQALSALLDRYWRQLVTFAADKLGSLDAAEDAVQEVFVRVWNHRTQLRPYSSPRAYLYRVLRNLIADDFRRRRLREGWGAGHQAEERETATPAAILEANQLATAANRAIAALPERRRDVFILAHLHGLSYRDVAEALGITRRTVANHMTLALRELRSTLAPYTEGDSGRPG
jgi:RNA polymerase sigma-70 factor (ECF subfamily)